jgi:hypothetical protein
MAGEVTLTTVNNIMKEVYQGRIQDQLQNEVVGIKRIEKSSNGVTHEVGGKYVTFPVRVKRNPSIGYRSELQQLQNPGTQGYASVRIGLKYGYGRIRISGQTMELAKTNAQAFANAMDYEVNGLKSDIAKDVNRIFYGNGTGFMATATVGTTTQNYLDVLTAQYVNVGDVVDVVNAAGAVQGASGRTVTAINRTSSPQRITVDGATFTSSAGWGIVRTGNYGLEPNGLGSIVSDTGTLFNIDPTSEATWKAINNNNSGTNRALSEGLMIKMTDDARVNGGQTSLILTSLGVRRAYFNLLTQQRRYTDTKEFSGGIRGLAFNNGREIPVVEDVDAPPNKLWFLDESSLTIYRSTDWSWLDTDGSVWKWLADYDAFQAVLHSYWELGVNRRNANGVLADITEG